MLLSDCLYCSGSIKAGTWFCPVLDKYFYSSLLPKLWSWGYSKLLELPELSLTINLGVTFYVILDPFIFKIN